MQRQPRYLDLPLLPRCVGSTPALLGGPVFEQGRARIVPPAQPSPSPTPSEKEAQKKDEQHKKPTPSPPPGKGTPPSGKGTPPQKGAPPKGKGKGKPPAKTLSPAGLKAEKVEPRKPDVIPGVQVKKLYWTSFRLDTKNSNTVWNEIDVEGANIDTDELEMLFADQPPGSRPRVPSLQRSETRKITVKKIQVLESQRRRQICVMLARLPDMRDTHDALMSMDKLRLNRDQVELLLLNAPPKEEVQLMQRAQKEHIIDDFNVWDAAEDFVISMMGIPHYQLRLQVWDFQNSFHDHAQAIATAEMYLSRACDCLLTSRSIRHLLAIALFAGNYLNGGTPRGRADGFAIEGLMQMRTVKMSHADRPGSLVDYLVRQMEKKYPGELAEMTAAGKAMECIKAAARYKLGDVREELLALMRKCEQMLKRVQQGSVAATDCPDDMSTEDDMFRQHAEILSARNTDLQELQSRFDKLEEKYGELRAWFHMDNKTSTMSTDEFFGIWDKFFSDIDHSRKALLEQERKQAKAQAAQARMSSAISSRSSARSSATLQRRNSVGTLRIHTEEEEEPRQPSELGSGSTPSGKRTPSHTRFVEKRRTLGDLGDLFKRRSE